MARKDGSFDYEEIEEEIDPNDITTTTKVDWKWILTRQIERVAKSRSTGDWGAFIDSIESWEMLLTPYIQGSEEHQEKQKEINEKYLKQAQQIHYPNERKFASIKRKIIQNIEVERAKEKAQFLMNVSAPFLYSTRI